MLLAVCPVFKCPSQFPFPTKAGAPYHDQICYNNKTDAEKGSGPTCSTWCTMDVNIGIGCGVPPHNFAQLCPSAGPSSCMPSANATACQARCDNTVGCSGELPGG